MSSYRLQWEKLLNEERIKPSARLEGESRSEFERDYGRTVYSSPFRRLRDKAQVFPLEPNDSVRTRLLHSLEVSSVAEDLASQVVREIIRPSHPTLSPDQLSDIPLLAATCGLIHDIGNPPFGHAGELAIKTWFKEKFGKHKKKTFFSVLGAENSAPVQDFFNFEGNAQATRIISNVELLVHNHGLNLTAGTLAAAQKYIAGSDEVEEHGRHEYSKPGHFFSEREIVGWAQEKTQSKGCRHPITYLVEAADDIVYCAVDLEDGIKRRVLLWEDVEAKLRSKAAGPLLDKVLDAAKSQVEPLKGTGRAYGDALAQTFRVAAISAMAVEARGVFLKRYAAIMNGEYHCELLADPTSGAAALIEGCKMILRADLYRHQDILRLEVRGRQVIHALLGFFWEAVKDLNSPKLDEISPKSYDGKLYFLLSENYRRGFERRIKEGKENELYCKLQLITDQVAGMTDTHACEVHKRLTNN